MLLFWPKPTSTAIVVAAIYRLVTKLQGRRLSFQCNRFLVHFHFKMAEESLLDDLDEALGDVHLKETPRLTKVAQSLQPCYEVR